MDAAIKEAGGVPLGKSRGRMLQAEKGIYKGPGTGFRCVDSGQGDRAEVKRAGSRPVAQRALQCRVLTPGEGAGLGKRVQAEDTVPHEVCADLGEGGEGGKCDPEGMESGGEAVQGSQEPSRLALKWLRQRWRRTDGTAYGRLPGVCQLRGIRNNIELF